MLTLKMKNQEEAASDIYTMVCEVLKYYLDMESIENLISS
jgi:hypothetical protein